jgi:hypothetical protein
MAYYRIYELDGANRIWKMQIADCSDDTEALLEARRVIRFGRRAEVWRMARCVGEVVGQDGREIFAALAPT